MDLKEESDTPPQKRPQTSQKTPTNKREIQLPCGQHKKGFWLF